MPSSATQRVIHQPGRGRGNTDTVSVSKPLRLVSDQSEVADSKSPKPPKRKPHERRVLFYNLSPEARQALVDKAIADGSRYVGAKDIEEELSCGTTVTGPLRTFDYHDHLCALQKKDKKITFAAAGQKGRGIFYPLTCGGSDDSVVMALSNALATEHTDVN